MALSPDSQKSLLSSQASINFSLFLGTFRSPNRGSSRLIALDSVRYTAKSPAERIMWYSRVVPDRPQPSTNTGASLLARPFTLGASLRVPCVIGVSPSLGFRTQRRNAYLPVLSRQTDFLNAVRQLLRVVLDLKFWNPDHHFVMVIYCLPHHAQQTFQVAFLPQLRAI